MKKIKYNKSYTYGQLCDLFELEKQTSGSNQRSQLNNLMRQYEISNPKRNNYIIKRELSLAEKLDKQIYHKNRGYIEPLMYTMLSEIYNNSIRVNMHTMLELLGIVNKDYHFAKWHSKECDLTITGYDSSGLNIFIKESEPMLKHIIIDVLKDMQRRKLLIVNMIPMFARKYRNLDTNKMYTKIWEASKDEIPKLLQAQRIALKNFNLEYWDELVWNQHGEAKDIIARELDIDYFYYDYEIILNKIGIKEYVTDDFESLRKGLNKHVQQKLKKSKQGNLKLLEQMEKEKYVEYLIDIENDFNLRGRKS